MRCSAVSPATAEKPCGSPSRRGPRLKA